MTRDRGQASVEYLGVMGLVCALVLAGMAVPALAGRDIAGIVVREVRRAICIVSGGECDLDRRPCVVASSQVEDSGGVDLAIVKLGSRELALREDRSDGTVAVTFLRDRQAGLDLTVGGGAHVRLGKRTLRLGAQAEATVLATLGSGTTWVLRDRAAADRLMRGLVVDRAGDLARRVTHGGRPDTDGAPAPAWTGSRRGLGVSLGASAGPGGLALGSADLAGVATERATGRRTYSVRRRNDLGASLSIGPRDPAGGGVGGDELYTVTVDRDGRPLDLGVLTGRDLDGHVGGIQGAVRREDEEHLDLTDDDNLAAARDFLREVVSPQPRLGRAVAVSAALRQRLDSDGVLDERTYAVSSRSTGIGAGAGTGIGHLGADFQRSEQGLRLVAARQRGPDGLWRTRDDCLRRS